MLEPVATSMNNFYWFDNINDSTNDSTNYSTNVISFTSAPGNIAPPVRRSP